ncbi:competence protein ComK [Gracilibacillus timonensis]|uniref:competence protein ComK n=1 Tax=Gracilibacillus timonensis TaxID=1816696 RepID=UPI000825BCAD|nr:competence protein ComK [Gracilibacillus timonensis]
MKISKETIPEINPNTLAIVGFQDDDGFFTRIVEQDEKDDYETTWSTHQVMNYTCKGFGISLQGLLDGTRMLSGITHKPPIAIDRISGMYFFPVESPLRKSCTWIAHSHVLEVEREDTHFTRVVFKNGRDILLNVSYASIINQVYRTAQYRYLLSNNIEHVLEHSQFVSEPPLHRKR